MNGLLQHCPRATLKLTLFGLLALVSATATAQDDTARMLENIRPVGRVCIAGQDCTTGMASQAPAAEVAPAAAVTQEPAVTEAPAATAPAGFDVAGTYQMSCFACHSTGAAGAPKTGDAAAWESRMAKGMDAVVANAINGLNAMPPKGMCMTCSDSDLRALVEYMLNPN